MEISRLEDRDSQEVAGDSNVMNVIYESANEIEISESNIKNLHNQLMKFNSKDDWHRGDYKQPVSYTHLTLPTICSV